MTPNGGISDRLITRFAASTTSVHLNRRFWRPSAGNAFPYTPLRYDTARASMRIRSTQALSP